MNRAGYTDPEFSAVRAFCSELVDVTLIHMLQNYDGATSAGLIRGGYHFAHPDESSGATQATYFLAHGGGWSADGITLPGALDIECEKSILQIPQNVFTGNRRD